jgi:hypothetical protein
LGFSELCTEENILILQGVNKIKINKIVLYLRASCPVNLIKYHAGNKTRAVIRSNKLLYHWLVMVDKAMNLQFAQEAEKFITSWTVFSPYNRTLFREVTKLIKTQTLRFFCVIARFLLSVDEICPLCSFDRASQINE